MDFITLKRLVSTMLAFVIALSFFNTITLCQTDNKINTKHDFCIGVGIESLDISQLVAIEIYEGYTNANVNVRKEPNTDSDIVETLDINTLVSYIVYNDKWVKVDNGYIYFEYIQDEKVELPKVDEYELYLLAHLIYSESGVLGELGMLYTGSVLLNRVKSDKYPNTIYGCITQSGQYAVWSNGSFDKEPSDLAWEIAEELLLYGSVLDSDYLYQANFKQSEDYITVGSGSYTTYYCR